MQNPSLLEFSDHFLITVTPFVSTRELYFLRFRLILTLKCLENDFTSVLLPFLYNVHSAANEYPYFLYVSYCEYRVGTIIGSRFT